MPRRLREPPIESFADLHAFASAPRNRGAIFRGVSDAAKHLLVPSVGRIKLRHKVRLSLTEYEESTFRAFKRLAVPYLDFSPRNDWEWLALAQHHGLATRLLDWSYNPLVAAFFAVDENIDTDAAIYAVSSLSAAEEHTDPFSVRRVMRYIPSHTTPRIFAQKGTFTIHPHPFDPYDSTSVRKVLISRETRFRLRDDLYRYGVSRGSLFPGLDGLAAEIRWRYAIPFSGTHSRAKVHDALRLVASSISKP